MISQPVAIVRRLLVTICVLGIAACAEAPQTRVDDRDTVAEHAARVALQQVGTPYRYGGSTPRGFDCSGLVHYSYALAGKRIPRTTKALYSKLPAVSQHAMRVGDLLFFRFDGKMSHVGLYLGNGRFVHAPSSGRTVSIESLRSAIYRDAFIRAGRPN